MRLHSFLHVPFEGLGSIADWAAGGGHAVTSTRWFAGDAAPAVASFDWLVVMGGPMGVYDEREYPWLVEEKRAVGAAVEAGKRVLGICLGAQLIATVCGASVHRNPYKEIGWFPIELTPGAATTAAGRALATVAPPVQPPAPSLQAPSPSPVFHWHGDTFDLPPGAIHVACSAACAHQAFSVDDRVVGLQFHLETTPASAAELIRNCPADLAPGPYVQSAEAMLTDPARFARINAAMHTLLDAVAPA